MKKLLLIPLALLLFVLLTAESCEDEPPKNTNNEFINQAQKTVQEYQSKFESAVPYPVGQISDSLERRQQVEKLLRFNDPNKIGYVYLFADTGQLVGFYTIKGKVSSTQSQLTVTNQTQCYKEDIDDQCVVLESPSDDGSYGPNEDGIFFFTTEGVYVGWNGKYLYLDSPLQVTTEPLVVYDGDSANPSSVAPDGLGISR